MSGHSEEAAEFPKLAGNMVVLHRDAISGYKLGCGCGEQFMYVPNGTNSIAFTWHPPHGNSQPTALCPRCNAIWNEKAEFVKRVTPIKFAYYHADSSDDGPRIAGIGSATSRAEAANMAANSLREDRTDWGVFVVKILTEEEADKLEKSVDQANRAMSVAALVNMLGLIPEGGGGGGEHRKE